MKYETYKGVNIVMPAIGESILSDTGHTYQVIRIVNVGKNGAVFLVKDREESKTYALKIQYNLLPRRINRFNREVEFLKAQKKTWLLSYHDSGTITFSGERYPFVITPYFAYNLEEYLLVTEIPYKGKIGIACSLLMALLYLGNNGFVHRDIKPQNILTNGEHVVLADFGLIKKVSEFCDTCERDEILSASASMPRHFRTPELVSYAKGEIDAVTVESDIFQTGLVLSWLFTGKNPLVSSESKLSAIVMENIPRIEGAYGEEVHNAICSMLCLKRTERSTAVESLHSFMQIYDKLNILKKDIA